MSFNSVEKQKQRNSSKSTKKTHKIGDLIHDENDEYKIFGFDLQGS